MPSRMGLRRFVLSSSAAGLAVLVLQVTAAAAFNPYTSGSIGYDFSYPQCGASAPNASFGIVGVNAGYPFTYYNSCLAAEYAAAARTGNASAYINTGRSEEHTSELQSQSNLVCRLLLEKKK